MKQILPNLKELNKNLSFAKNAFTKGGFRHVTHYIDGLITLNKKTIKQISKASIDENHHSAINRILTEASFHQEELEQRLLKKIDFMTKGLYKILIFDDTLNERNGTKIEETQFHKDHSSDSFIKGHQFFTSMIHTSIIQFPLFPKLYSKNTESKIQMAQDLIEKVNESMVIDAVLMDSWYSDKKIIKKCQTKGIKVICVIKTNRVISLNRGKWQSLSSFSNNLTADEYENYYIDEVKYQIATFKVKLKGIPKVKMLVSKEYKEKDKKWLNNFHLISTRLKDTPTQIIREYSLRWTIETFHRDIKQNLGFESTFLRRKEGIVRHAIFVVIAYIILKLFMYYRGMDLTIGECCAHIQNREMDGFVREIIEIEDKKERMDYFEKVFIRECAKV